VFLAMKHEGLPLKSDMISCLLLRDTKPQQYISFPCFKTIHQWEWDSYHKKHRGAQAHNMMLEQRSSSSKPH
jgi:hypothetical protein